MNSTTVLFIVLVALLSVAIAFFQYFFKVKKSPKIHILLFALKALSLFLLGLLLINPKIKVQETENIKPVLSVLIDNSLSTKFFKEEKQAEEALLKVKNNAELQDKFDVAYFSFGNEINVLDSLTFTEPHTNISKALKAVNELNKDKNSAVILLTDGNQTQGNDYEFLSTKNKIYPVVLGDTTKYQDLQIAQLNVNKYSYLDNKFPVEAMLLYEGDDTVTSTFSISHKGKRVFSKKVSFSPNTPTQTITTNLLSSVKGVQYYTASLSKLSNEKNAKNNTKNFSVEVFDEQTKVLLLSSFLHPDLGALKRAIETNKQRKVDIALLSDKINFNAYQFYVLYQPTASFKDVFTKLNSNFLVITGVQTDWSFLNTLNLGVQKKALSQQEEYNAVFNLQFLTFLQDDIGFNQFPPLLDAYGTVQINKEAQSMLFQKYAGVKTTQPLLATFEENDNKYAFLLGEGIWKWRAASFLKDQSFENFDSFIANLTQYLASTKKRKRLEVNSEKLYAANEPIIITAFYLDKNYKFDDRASLELTLTNKTTKEQQKLPLSLVSNSYQVSVEGLASGEYSYKVSVDNQNISSYGQFKITDYQIEEQFTNANLDKLKLLAHKTKGEVFNTSNFDVLLKKLTKNASFYTTQKSTIKNKNILDWKWLLVCILLLLSFEWFIRKYYGKI